MENGYKNIIHAEYFALNELPFQSYTRFVKSGKITLKIDLRCVKFIVAQGNYSKIFFDDHKTLLLSIQIHKIRDFLKDNSFIRVHRSYIISISKIDKIEDDMVYIKNHNLPIGKSYKQDFFKCIHGLIITGNDTFGLDI